MTRELTLEERYEWLLETMRHLAALPTLSEDDFDYTVFEMLVPDVVSCLHEDSLRPLVENGRLPGSIQEELAGVRSSFLALAESSQRRGNQWLAISQRCGDVLAELHEDPA